MGTRFDELELLKPVELAMVGALDLPPAMPAATSDPLRLASRFRRSLAFLTDVSLFIALALAMSPLLPARDLSLSRLSDLGIAAGFAGFVLLISFHYFLYSWIVWGKTIGGAIFDLRVADVSGAPIDFRNASRRWAGMLIGGLTGGLGFLLALLPGAASLPDRMSNSRCFVAASGGAN